jgi:integrase
MRELGLGPAIGRAAVSLPDARVKARALYDIHKAGRDPLEERKLGRIAAAAETAKGVTFSEAADRYIEAHRASWRSAKHATAWSFTLATYVNPLIGRLPVQSIDTGLVLKILEPIWNIKSETASRLRGRIESILDWAKAREYRSGENPARWRGHLENLLPAKDKIVRVKHHAALPYTEICAFTAKLREQSGVAARALEFTIITAARSGEVLGAQRSEIATDNTWIVPGERMKAGIEHRVPLSARAGEIIAALPRVNDFIFPGRLAGQGLGTDALSEVVKRVVGHAGHVTVHGFRSSFRDWAAERTNFPSEVIEMALAHKVGSKVEAAYRRSDQLEKRRLLMEAWSVFCATASERQESVVVPIRATP